jgi:hypothetical protein
MIMYLAASSLPLTILVDLAGLLGVLRGDLFFPLGPDSVLGLISGVASRSVDILSEGKRFQIKPIESIDYIVSY